MFRKLAYFIPLLPRRGVPFVPSTEVLAKCNEPILVREHFDPEQKAYEHAKQVKAQLDLRIFACENKEKNIIPAEEFNLLVLGIPTRVAAWSAVLYHSVDFDILFAPTWAFLGVMAAIGFNPAVDRMDNYNKIMDELRRL